MKNVIRYVAVVCSTLLLSSAANAQNYYPLEHGGYKNVEQSYGYQPGDEGYWVILASIPTDDLAAWEKQGRRVIAQTQGCGIQTDNALSDDFVGFRPGYNVFYLGPFDKRSAENIVWKARYCISDAYMKYGKYIGN